MSARYRLRVREARNQRAVIYDIDASTLDEAISYAEQFVADHFIGCIAEVVDTTVHHPDHNIVHVAERAYRPAQESASDALDRERDAARASASDALDHSSESDSSEE